MKTRWLVGVFLLLSLVGRVCAESREAEWKQYYAAIGRQLPKTALEKLKPIIADALADEAYADAIKGICRKVALEATLAGEGSEGKIIRLQSELEQAPSPMKPMMEAILADWYWEYFQQNRWKFYQRTQTQESPGADIQTWDLSRILAEIDQHFTNALSHDAELKRAPISDYDDLLVAGTAPDRYRPTLYDFIAFHALKFYQAGEHAQTKSEDEFEVSSDGPIFGKVVDFIQWKPETADKTSPKLKAIKLYQAVLTFHKNDSDRAAFNDADLGRLEFGNNQAVGESKADQYKTSLQRFASDTESQEISARALALLATQLDQEGDKIQAHRLAERGSDRFPKSDGGVRCFNLIQQIEQKSAQLKTEMVWNAPWPTLDVTYANITKVYFRIIPFDFSRQILKKRWSLGGFNTKDEVDEVLGLTPTLAWEADLPATADFKPRTEKLAVPTSLKYGFYIVVASHDPSFRNKNNYLSMTGVWVSDLALVVRATDGHPVHTGLVVRAGSGEPVSEARITFWERLHNGSIKKGSTTYSDENGQFHFSTDEQSVVILAEYKDQAVSSAREIYTNNGHVEDPEQFRTIFFTDRALYRPGQLVQYKGVSIQFSHKDAQYIACARRPVTVIFNDANGRELARAERLTNDYGSFEGVFTAPRGALTGRMTIQVLDQTGSAAVNVEEYKRPKFQVAVEPPAEAPKLNAAVEVKVRATAYTGATIGGAKVQWSVDRNTHLPSWCWWWHGEVEKTIAHGVGVTGPDGTLTVQFTAEPDPALPIKNEPVFAFAVHADVTDLTGETRSDDRTVSVGYTALKATISADDWQTAERAVAFSIATESLDGGPQPATGIVKVYALKQPSRVERVSLSGEDFWGRMQGDEPVADASYPESWDLGAPVVEKSFTTDAAGKQQLEVALESGIYRVLLETKDRFGRQVTARQTVRVLDSASHYYTVKEPNRVTSSHWSVEPGETFSALWGTGYETGRALIELECAGKTMQRYWTAAGLTQAVVSQAVSEEMRGGFTLRVTYVRENRAYITETLVDVPWSNKQLSIKWESFRSKLMPGQKETWTAIVTGPKGTPQAAEMVASLYDASLDQYLPLDWPRGFGVFRQEFLRGPSVFQNAEMDLTAISNWKGPRLRDTDWRYRTFPSEIFRDDLDDESIVLSPFVVNASEDAGSYGSNTTLAGTRVRTDLRDLASPMSAVSGELAKQSGGLPSNNSPAKLPLDLTKVSSRKNLSETAFFFPQLLTDEQGVVKMVFTMPEALTEWKFLGFAHDQQLRAGLLTGKAVTSKDLMVEPNSPRFVREGDAIEFTVKVSNQSDQSQKGVVKLTFADATTEKSADEALSNLHSEQAFEVPPKQSRTYAWKIAVPDGLGFLTYKAAAATDKFSDGEEGFLPVLSRRILVTESLPLPIRGKATRNFVFQKLLESGRSSTLRQQSLTVQMVSQPAWYAVMALPYLIEYPYECSEQVFDRLFANALAQEIANSDPKIRRVFDQWKNTSIPQSPLEKNQDLKSVMLAETPWVQEANAETQARQNIGLLFDNNRLDEETARALRTLSDRQLNNGLWPWFPGGEGSEYISLYIATGFGRLRPLGIKVDLQPALKAWASLDGSLDAEYSRIKREGKPDEYVPSPADAFYLYGRSFFLEDRAVQSRDAEAFDFFVRQSRKNWTKLDSRQSQAHLAIALQRLGDKATPEDIMKSLKERSIHSDEMGMYWQDFDTSWWWWYQAPIETQAVMIEAFDEVSHDAQAVEDCKVWLLKQKQTQAWSTTKATAEAVYALLRRGTNLLSSDTLVQVSLGGKTITPEKAEAGTGFYEEKFVRDEIKPSMGNITVRKLDDGVSWGSAHWQYLEDIGKITPHKETPLKLKKTLYIRELTGKGPVLKPVQGPLAVGDELVVRLELRSDREMEFIHLKDQRGSGTEPVNVLSGYKYRDGLGYYESTRDTATDFFIDRLPRGVYIFEYSTRVQLKGHYQSGIADIQCMYAPEFNSHSESVDLVVE